MKAVIPLVGSQIDRGLETNISAAPTKDQLFQNCLFYQTKNPFTGKNSIFVERRIGMPASGTTDTNFAEIDGFYYWKAVGTMVRYGYDNTGPGVVARYTTIDSALSSVSQQVGNSLRVFHVSEGKNSSGTACVFVVSAGAGNTYTTIYMMPDLAGSDTHITVPSGSCGHPVYFSGYMFVANTDGRIYNSTLNDPTAGYTDFIGVDMHPGSLVTVFRQEHHIIALKTHSMEVYQLGEQSVGSPLTRVTELSSRVGIFKDVTGTTWSSLPITSPPIVSGDNTVYWLGQGEDGLGIYTLDNMRPKKISGSMQDKYLSKYGGYIKYLVVGKRRLLLVYCTNVWLCLDTETGIWSVWISAKSGTMFRTWANTYNGEGLIGANSNIYYTWNPTSTVPYLDVDTSITRKIRLENIDFDTNSLKDFPSLSILGDKQTSTSNISVRWSKDDYQNWSTAKDIDMSSSDPSVDALGTSRKIAFELSDTVENPQRIHSLELEYNVHD